MCDFIRMETGSRWRGGSRAWPAILMAALLIAMFWRVLFVGEGLSTDGTLVRYWQPWVDTEFADDPPPSNLLLRDQFGSFNANEEFISRWVRRGVWPLWNPDLAHGVPSVASIQNAEYYPTNLLFWFLPPFWTRGLRSILRLMLCLGATYGFGRTIGMGRPAATLAAVSFAFCGFNVVWLGHPPTNVSILLPLMLWTLERTLQRGSFGWAAGLTLAAGAALLGGHTPTVLHVSVAIAIWLAYRLAVSPTHPAPRLRVPTLAPRFVLIALGGLALGSAALLPWMEYLGESPDAVFALRNARTLSWETLIVWIIPDFYGNPVGPGTSWDARFYGIGGWENYCERTGYIGVAGLVLAVIALVARRPRHTVLPWAAVLVVSAIWVYDPPVLGTLFRTLPAFEIINNSKMVSTLAFALVILAGLGADVLFDQRGSLPRAWGAAIVATIGGGALVVALWPTAEASAWLVETGRQGSFLRDCLWVLVPLAAVFLGLALSSSSRRGAVPLILVVVAFDLWRFGSDFNPTITFDQAAPATPGIHYLQEHATGGRVLPVGKRLLYGNVLLRYGLADVRGLDRINVSHYEYLVTGRTGDYDFSSHLDAIPDTLAALNVPYAAFPKGTNLGTGSEVVYDEELRIVRLPGSMPRALLVHDARVVGSDAEARRAIATAEVDLQRTVLLGPSAPPAFTNLPGGGARSGDIVRITAARPNDLWLEVEAEVPGLLVVNDTFFPGWRAEVDGRPVPIVRANVAFRAVPIDAGAHRVVFRYRPWTALGGMALTVGTFGVIMLLAGGRALSRRRVQV